MKRIHLTLMLFLLWCMHIEAQNYQPMVIENAHFVTYNHYQSGYKNTFAFVIRGDTLHNGILYKKIIEQDLIPDDQFGPFEIVSERFFGFIREDINERKVY